MRYAPSPSLTAALTFSIRTGLAASTVTPGMAAPLVSLTTPVIALWANAVPDSADIHAHNAMKAKRPVAVVISYLLNASRASPRRANDREVVCQRLSAHNPPRTVPKLRVRRYPSACRDPTVIARQARGATLPLRSRRRAPWRRRDRRRRLRRDD